MSFDQERRLFDACLDAANDAERERVLESWPDAVAAGPGSQAPAGSRGSPELHGRVARSP